MERKKYVDSVWEKLNTSESVNEPEKSPLIPKNEYAAINLSQQFLSEEEES